jgi:muconate cycloisomerase|uniref:mandelate racemase/muconate lactonizing enzyme family protein n=1 Tax=Cephaloticoccus sp. TaxID=1985742 RepID=UPI00404AFAB7
MSRIIRVEIGRFDYAVAGEFKFFKPGPDGRIRRPSVLVRLTDENGMTGWGQSVPVPTWTYETVESVLTTLEFYLAEVVLGRDPADFAGLHAAMNTAIRPAFSVGQPLCKAAIDLACHDLVGKQRGVPAWQLFGEPASVREEILLSWTVASPKLENAEQQMLEGRARGYRNFNIKVGAPQSAEYDLELARKVRAFAPDGFLWADANTGYTPVEALAIAPKLRDVGVDVLESPLAPTRIRGYRDLKKQGALPVLMDEGIVGPEVAEEFIALDMMDGIAMKPARNAGLWPSVQIVNQLRAKGLTVLGSGLTDPDFSLLGALHLFAWSGIARPCALNGPQFLADSLFGDLLKPTDDVIKLPTAPGLGCTPDARAVAALRVVAEELK